MTACVSPFHINTAVNQAANVALCLPVGNLLFIRAGYSYLIPA